MKPWYGSARQHGMSAKEWALVFLIALAVHLLLLFLFCPLPLEIAEPSQDSRYTLFLEEPENWNGKDPYGIGYWLRYTDPEPLLKPDPKYGFSMFCGKNEITIPEPVLFQHGLPELGARWLFQPDKTPAERSPADFAVGADTAVFPHRSLLPKAERKIEYPVWTDGEGRIFTGLFWPDEGAVRLMKRQYADKPSVLRLTLRNHQFPEVNILRSCGNVKLDMLAARQLQARKENFSGGSYPRVEYYTVVWRLPDRNSILKEDRL